MLYNPTPLKGRGTEYFYNCPNHIKLILLQKNKPIGFIHISFSPQKSFCELSGGLIPNYINSGLGIYASCFVLKYLFSRNPNIRIKAVVSDTNTRSERMLKKLGFNTSSTKDRLKILDCTISSFNNTFIDYLLSRIN